MTGQARRRAIKTRFVDPDHQGVREVFEAALGGDVEKLEKVLRRSTSIDVNWTHRMEVDWDDIDADGSCKCWDGTALHAAARLRHLDATRLLLDRGADVNADAGGFYHDDTEPDGDELNSAGSDGDGPGRGEDRCGLQTPLHASLLGARPISVELVRVLLEAGADVNLACLYSSDDNAVPLILELLGLFERHGLDLEKPLPGPVKETFVRSAVNRGSTEVLRWGVSRGVSVPDDILAHRWVDEEMLRCLVDEAGFRNANLDGLSRLRLGLPGRSDDDDAATLSLIRRILDNLPAPPAPGLVSKAFCAAVGTGDRAMARFWLDRGADVNQPSAPHGAMTPLFAAMSRNDEAPDPGMVRMLLEGGGDNVAGDAPGRYGGRSPLLAALAHACPDVEVIRMLLDKGADVNASWNGNALHAAARHGSPELVQLLIDRGADLEARNDKAETPLLALAYPTHHHAGLVGCARVFASAGADFGAVDHRDRTLLHLLADPERALPVWVPDVVRGVARVAVDSGGGGGGVDLERRDWSGHTATDRFKERFLGPD